MAEAFDLHGPDINDNFGLGEAFRETGRDLYERDKGDNRDEDNGHGDTYSFGEVDTYNGPYEQTSNQDEFNFETASAPNEVEKPEEISIPTYEPMDFSFLSVDSDSEEDKDKYRNKTYATSEQMNNFFEFMKDKQADYNNRELERKEKEIEDFRDELKKGLDSLKTGTEKSKDKRPDFEIKSAVPPSPGSGTRAQLEKDAKTSPMYASSDLDNIFETNSEKMGQKNYEWAKSNFTDEEWAERQKEHAEKEKWDNYRSDFLKRAGDLTIKKEPDEEGPAEYDYDRLHAVEDDWEPLKEEMKAHPDFEKDVYENYWNSLEKGIYDGYSKLEDAAKASPMYAEAGVPDSPKLTTDLNATPEEMEAAKKQALEPKWNDIERISKDFDFSNAKEPETKEVGWGPFKHEVLADNKISGLYTAQQMKEMDNFIRKTESKLGQDITDVANKVTAGIAPTTEDITGKFDRTNYKSAVDQVAQDYLSKGKDVQQAIDYVNKLVEGASMGLAKQGVEYYLLTGDALNKTAESVQAVENQILVSLEKGIITEESALEAIDKAHQITNMDQLKSLATSPALQGIEITLATAAGATLLAKAASKIAPIVVDKLLKSNSKIGNKILEKLANNPAVKQNYKNRAFQEVFEAQKAGEQGGRMLTIDEIGARDLRVRELQRIIVDNRKTYNKAYDDFLRKNPKSTLDEWYSYADKIPELKNFRAAQEELVDLKKLIGLSKGNQPRALTDLDKAVNETKMKMAQSKLDNAVEYAISKSDDLSVNDIRSLMRALEDGTIDAALLLDASTQTIVDAIHKNKGDAAKVAAAIGAGTAAVDKASATPTGTFDESGKQIDSKDIVADYKKNPYTGEDAVTLQTREGQVTLPLHEAVIVGEAEKLTPERGYTEEVKKAAEGMDVYERQPETRKAEVVDINNLPPDLPEKSFWTKAGDVVQAILGGRDTNNDRTISAQEWYESTLKPVADSIKDFFSLPDFKSKLEAIGNKVESTLYNITSSIPGVIDLKTGEVQTIDQPIKATKETINNIEDKIINALPNWTDGVKNETIKEGVAGVVAGKIGNQFYGDSVAAVTLAKMAGAYTAATVGEIAHLYGKDLTNDEKGAINLVVTNAVGLPLAPVTSIVRDMQAMTGIPARARIEKTFNPDEAGSIMIVPYSEGTSGRSSGTKSSYGWSSDITNADSKYSGYRERAKNTNLATDYNEGLAQEMNEAVSDMKVKIFNVYKNEPDYIRKAIDKVLKSYREQW